MTTLDTEPARQRSDTARLSHAAHRARAEPEADVTACRSERSLEGEATRMLE
ncbi:MAG: hypothetical protein ACO3NZ_07970 [Pirellulales bacterium]